MPSPHSFQAATSANGRLYVFETRLRRRRADGRPHAFDAAANRWTALPSPPSSASGRGGATLECGGRRRRAGCGFDGHDVRPAPLRPARRALGARALRLAPLRARSSRRSRLPRALLSSAARCRRRPRPRGRGGFAPTSSPSTPPAARRSTCAVEAARVGRRRVGGGRRALADARPPLRRPRRLRRRAGAPRRRVAARCGVRWRISSLMRERGERENANDLGPALTRQSNLRGPCAARRGGTLGLLAGGPRERELCVFSTSRDHPRLWCSERRGMRTATGRRIFGHRGARRHVHRRDPPLGLRLF